MNGFEFLISKSASEIVKLLKKSVDEPSGSQKYKSVLNKTTTHISESEYMLYMYHAAQKLRKEAVSDRFRIWAANKCNSSLQNT